MPQTDNPSITIQGLDNLIRSFEQARVDLPEEFSRAMVASTIDVKQEAQELVAVKTGALRQSIHEEPVQHNPLIGRVLVGQKYGRDLEYGTRPRTITPVRAKMLAFSVGGSMVFARSVNHPGTKPQPFLVPALHNNAEKIKDNFGRAAMAVLAKIKGA